MQNEPVFDVVYIGNYTKDTIITPSGTRYVDGGAVNYAAHAAVCLRVKVGVVTRLAEEDHRMIDSLVASGVTCLPVYTPFSTCVVLEYPTTNPDIRNLYVTHTAGSIGVDQVAGLKTRAAVIGTSLRGEVGLDVIENLHERGFLVGLDVQGFVRVLRGQSLVYEPWPEMAAALALVDVLKSDAVEAEFLTGEKDIRKATLVYAALGPQEIVLTHKDGVLLYDHGCFHEAGFYPERLDGRSGRGDTCLGSYIAMRLNCSSEKALTWAAAVTSLKMERLGTFDRTPLEVEEFIRLKYAQSAPHGFIQPVL